MTTIFNRYRDKEKRRMLRSRMPEPEVILWSKLQRRQQMGFKFQRQYSIINFVVDFYCPKLKLAIEVDGKSHLTKSAKEYDKLRQDNIELANIKFLRFTNEQVKKHLNCVIQEIRKKIVTLNPPCPPLIKGGSPKDGGSRKINELNNKPPCPLY